MPDVVTLTAERVRELLDYDPATGVFRWRVSLMGRGAKAGAIAGTSNGQGRRQIKIEQRIYIASRLAFLWMTGRWPYRFVDHINGDTANDRWANLRQATDAQNAANSRAKGTLGFKGVTWDKSRQRFVARIKVNYRTINLGRFETAEAAHAVYVKAAQRHFGEFARAA